MTKQDIEFIKTQIENINFETPSMPLSEWEVWTSGAVTMYSAIMDMLYDLDMDMLYDSQIHSKVSDTLSIIPPKVKKGDE